MANADDPVLLDNCAISACHEVGGWGALVARYRLESVETVQSEAATGFQHREIIDPREFRKSVIVHSVDLADRLALQLEYPSLASLDEGERDLWVHALGRQDGWILCGPDIASIKFGIEVGYRERLVSLEQLFDEIGFKPQTRLQENQTKKWLDATIARIALDIAFTAMKK